MKKIWIYTTALSSLGVNSALALNNYYQEAYIEIADNKETPLKQTGSAVTLVDKSELDNKSSLSAHEILASTPSAYVANSGGLGQAATLSLRGLPAAQTKILLNDIEIADRSLPQPYYNFAYMPSSSLERIEIARGNQSTLHGSDAMGGVVNMQSFFDKDSQGAFGRLGIMGGSYDTAQFYMRGGYNGSRAGLSLYGDYVQTNGFSAAAEKNGNREADGYENLTLGFNGWYDINPFWSLKGGLHYMDSKADYDGSFYDFASGVSTPMDAENKAKSHENMAYIKLEGSELLDGRFNNRFDMSFAETHRNYDAEAFGGGRSLSAYESLQYKGRWKGDFQLNPLLNMALGAEYSHVLAQISTDYNTLDEKIDEAALWGLATITPWDDFYITLGGRWQNHEIFGDELTGRATLSYGVEKTQTRLHSSLATGFRAPSLYELFDPSYGNKNLKPEDSFSADLGVEQKLWNEQVTLDVTGFYNEVDNKILYQPLGLYKGSYFNISQEKSIGMEASIKAHIFDKLDMGASYAYIKAWNPLTHEDSLRQPRHRGSLSLTWQVTDKLKLGTDFKAYSSQYDYYKAGENIKLGGYGLVDLRAEYELSHQIKFKGYIHNLLDKQYEPVFGYSSQGLSAYMGLEANF